MASSVAWRRLATAGGVYGSAVVGFLATVIAARELDRDGFGVLTVVVATTGFVQLLLDFTIDEALVKFGFRYSARAEFGRLRRLFRVAALVKVLGGLAGTAALLVLAPFANTIFGHGGVVVPMAIAAAIPLVQAPEGVAGTAILLRNRIDIRAWFLLVSMVLRFVGIVVGAHYGVVEAVAGMVLAQVAATAAVGVAGFAAFRRFPRHDVVPLGEDAPALRRFVVQSTIGSGIASARGTFPAMLVGLVASPRGAADFRVAQAPQTAAQTLSAPARLVLLTEQTHHFEHGRIDRIRSLLRRYMLATSAILVVLVPLGWWAMPWLVDVVYTSKYSGSVEAARLILVASAVQLVFGWTKSFPISIGRPVLRIVAQGVEVAVLVPALLVMAWLWGAPGAGGAILLSSLALAAVWTVFLLRLNKGVLALPAEAATP
jgi:O-antigen/teichoic acid export membrane protein